MSNAGFELGDYTTTKIKTLLGAMITLPLVIYGTLFLSQSPSNIFNSACFHVCFIMIIKCTTCWQYTLNSFVLNRLREISINTYF